MALEHPNLAIVFNVSFNKSSLKGGTALSHGRLSVCSS